MPEITKQTQTPEIDAGIACLGRAARLLDAPLDMVALLNSPLLRSQDQDSTHQLANLAIQEKLHAIVLDHVTAEQIKDCHLPMLIHVFGARYSTKPDYYVLCTGIRHGKVNLFSPSRCELSIPLSEFDEDRRGEVVVLSRQELAAADRVVRRAVPIAQIAMMVGIVCSAGVLFISQRRQMSDSIAPGVIRGALAARFQFPSLVSAAVVLAIVSRLAAGQSLVPPPPAAAGEPIDFMLPAGNAVTNATAKPLEISVDAARGRFAAGALFVDARDAGEFDAGHIKGAINCPATDISRWHLHLAGIDSHCPIVVYCAMASCKKGEYVATFLLANGFTDACLYRDGWVKWTGAKEAR
jgi:rhodanese-related sulfurtransferase